MARCCAVGVFEEAQLYSPVTQSDDGKVEVHLGKDHPGFNDAVYRARRNEIAAAAMEWEPGQPVPQVFGRGRALGGGRRSGHVQLPGEALLQVFLLDRERFHLLAVGGRVGEG